MRWEDCRLTKMESFSSFDPLGSPWFGLEQLLHGHGLVDMVLGQGDWFAGDEEPHIGVHRVLRVQPGQSCAH
jgi:hypothetical protein